LERKKVDKLGQH
jgi:hypothetical protein